MVEDELLQRAREGDKDAVHDILQMYTPLVKSIASHFFMTGGSPEDLVQEGLVGLYSAIGSYNRESHASFTTYAYICVRNAIRDQVKKSNGTKQAPLNDSVPILEISEGLFIGENPEDEVIKTENRQEFHHKISGILSPYEFQVIVMYMDGMSTKEICDALPKARQPKSVDNAIARAKAKISKLYQDTAEE
ncbi:MAG: sigma-70 family RNA polymerase sigma factor [Clostridia bacterium]|nr:sigma-70 family RNA polymerase sigma factor [Clostridia bacterium]